MLPKAFLFNVDSLWLVLLITTKNSSDISIGFHFFYDCDSPTSGKRTLHRSQILQKILGAGQIVMITEEDTQIPVCSEFVEQNLRPMKYIRGFYKPKYSGILSQKFFNDLSGELRFTRAFVNKELEQGTSELQKVSILGSHIVFARQVIQVLKNLSVRYQKFWIIQKE